MLSDLLHHAKSALLDAIPQRLQHHVINASRAGAMLIVIRARCARSAVLASMVLQDRTE